MTEIKNKSPELLQDIFRSARIKHIPRGQILLYEGDIPKDVFIIKTGVVKVYDIDEQGNEKILHILKAPALMPFAFFTGTGKSLKWFYSALTDCDLYVLASEELHKRMIQNGELAVALTNNYASDVHELLVRLSSLSKTNTRDKVVSVLKFLLVCHASERRSGWWRVNFSASHQLLADLAGITRESTATVMKELQNQKIIRNPRLTILEINSDKLLKE